MTWSRRLLALVGVFGVLVGSGCTSTLPPERLLVLPSVPLPTPRTIVRHGVTYRMAEVAPAAAMLDRAQPDEIQLLVFRAENHSYPQCSQLSPSARVVRETADKVFVVAFAYGKRVSGNVGCSYSRLSTAPALYATLTLHLQEAVGSRVLVDVKTGQFIGIAADQRPPTPSYVPSGYRQSLVNSFNADNYFVAVRQFTSGNHIIEIRLRSATAWQQNGKVVGNTDIAGHFATVTDQNDERCVSWTDDQRLIREVCSLSTRGGAYLSTDQLEGIAQSLTP
jgi:hypothetical protein